MADPAWWPTLADLERKAGGAFKLVELAGAATYGDAVYVAFTDSCRLNGRRLVREAVTVKHDPEALDNLDAETASGLRRMATVFAFNTAWNDGSGNEAMPEKLAAEVQAELTELDKIATGLRRIGRASGQPGPALAQPARLVDYDPDGAGISRTGFRRGMI